MARAKKKKPVAEEPIEKQAELIASELSAN
jgi:hypothetical protein